MKEGKTLSGDLDFSAQEDPSAKKWAEYIAEELFQGETGEQKKSAGADGKICSWSASSFSTTLPLPFSANRNGGRRPRAYPG
jgi:hypothetical protein